MDGAEDRVGYGPSHLAGMRPLFVVSAERVFQPPRPTTAEKTAEDGGSPHHDAMTMLIMTNTVGSEEGGSAAKHKVRVQGRGSIRRFLPPLPSGEPHNPVVGKPVRGCDWWAPLAVRG